MVRLDKQIDFSFSFLIFLAVISNFLTSPDCFPVAALRSPPMDQRELEARVKALTKCVAANEPPENAIKLLETLKKDASPTEEMLRVRDGAT